MSSPLSRYRYTQTFLILFALLHFFPPIFATRFLGGSPPAALPTPKDEPSVSHVGMEYTPPYNAYRWPGELPMTLKYAFFQENPIDYLSQTDVESAFARAFATWSAVIPVSFKKTDNISLADVTVAFFRGDHGDGHPFDGMGGELAHTWSPPAGIIHMDADERWAVDFHKEKSKHAQDLQSVATHEIGHLLGLAHTEFKGAIMYPTISPRMKRVDLTIDDVMRVQGLYGPNPNFDPSAVLVYSSASSRRFSGQLIIILLASMLIGIL